jgi:hypothetical protein
VRKNDEALKKELDAVIAKGKSALDDILRRYGVRLYPAEGEPS